MQIGIRKSSRDRSDSRPQRGNTRSPSQNPSSSFYLTLKVSSFVKWYFISQSFKNRRPALFLVYCHFHKGRFDPLVCQNFTFCIFLRILHCPLPYTLANLSINSCVRQHRGLRDRVRHCPFPDMLAPVVQCYISYDLLP
ncbi:hypothetical protein AVEN_150902-1 [Araneus ventricosus]|uniref:Uncharacterized protein n=1 Tax=Araneus ventricosus TaxID=182803 RepID=A0A4Y2C8Q8_ARAVE|nr:hypothetical protein AVEN_150902-1 [Araneus ventricosus]